MWDQALDQLGVELSQGRACTTERLREGRQEWSVLRHLHRQLKLAAEQRGGELPLIHARQVRLVKDGLDELSGEKRNSQVLFRTFLCINDADLNRAAIETSDGTPCVQPFILQDLSRVEGRDIAVDTLEQLLIPLVAEDSLWDHLPSDRGDALAVVLIDGEPLIQVGRALAVPKRTAAGDRREQREHDATGRVQVRKLVFGSEWQIDVHALQVGPAV